MIFRFGLSHFEALKISFQTGGRWQNMRKRTGQGQRFLHAIDILLVTLVLAGVLAILGISVPTCAGDAQRLAASEDAAAPTPPPASEKIGAYDPTLPWQTREGGLFCANYFAIKDARAALEAQDQKWFQSTGCLIADAGRRVVLIDAPNVAGNVIWKGRVLDPVTKDGVDTYFSEYDVVTFVRGGLFPTQDKAEREFKELVAINNQGRPRVYAVLPQHLLSRPSRNQRG
jgi:hypothetical protein